VRRLGANRAGEIRITRLLRNARVSVAAMMASGGARTAKVVKARRILANQDTTTLRDDGRQNSIVLHPTIALDADDGALPGLVDAVVLRRSGGKTRLPRSRAFAEKESRRWLDSAQSAASLLEAGAQAVTSVMDREGDIYELFAKRPVNVDLLVRAAQDRTLADGGRLFDCTATLPPWSAQRRCCNWCATAMAPPGGHSPTSSMPPTSPPWRPSAPASKARPRDRRTRIRPALSPAPPGSAPASAAGPATTASQVPSSCSTACTASAPCSKAGAFAMCESRRAQAPWTAIRATPRRA